MVYVYTDGSCKAGVGGWAWTTLDGESDSGSALSTTNQRMELKAVLEALKAYSETPALVIVSDSRYVVNCFGQRWWAKWLITGWIGSQGQDVANRDLWEPIVALVEARMGDITFEWVKGHSGDPGNDLADSLALRAREARTRVMSDIRETDVTDDAIVTGGIKVKEVSIVREPLVDQQLLQVNKLIMEEGLDCD